MVRICRSVLYIVTFLRRVVEDADPYGAKHAYPPFPVSLPGLTPKLSRKARWKAE